MDDRRPLPEVDRLCPKCGHTRATGPEYRRGIGKDAEIGEHLRFYCIRCRYIMSEPTADQDTPQRRAELKTIFERRARGSAPAADPTPRRSWGWR